jgi:uncharacterized membrane protein YfcA
MKRVRILLYEVAATSALIGGVLGVVGALSMWQEWEEHGPSPWWILVGGVVACVTGAILFKISPRRRGH